MSENFPTDFASEFPAEFPTEFPRNFPTNLAPRSEAVPDGCTLRHRSLELLGELAASLQSSQNALLSRDLAAIERGTREQKQLQQALWEAQAEARAKDQPKYAAEFRVLQLARVQLALLARAQRNLHALSHLLAGPGASYRPPAPAPALRRAAGAGEKGSSCRV